MTKLHDLYAQGGQSPWIDDLRRGYLNDGGLQKLVSDGIRGVTSNPTILAKARSTAGSDYDAQFSELITGGASVDSAYWDLVIQDVKGALAVLRPVYDSCDGADGFVSVEVAPALAHDTARTVAAARDLHRPDQRAESVRQDPRNQGRRPGDRDDDRRRQEHQRDPDLQPRTVRRSDGGVPLRPRALGRERR